jgi:hypothetical protein
VSTHGNSSAKQALTVDAAEDAATVTTTGTFTKTLPPLKTGLHVQSPDAQRSVLTSSASEGSSVKAQPSQRSSAALSTPRLTTRLAGNYVLWGIAIGFVLSLSKAGPKYLDPGTPPLALNKDFIEELGFIDRVRTPNLDRRRRFVERIGHCQG